MIVNPRRNSSRAVLFAAAVVVIAVIVWMCVGQGSGASRSAASTEQPGKPEAQSRSNEGAENPAAPKPVGIPELALKFSPQEYIKNASNKAAALAALFEYTHDPDYLDALKQRALTDPDAAVLAAILMTRQEGGKESLEERLSMLRQAREKFPKDPLIALCLAGSEAQAGNHEAALGTIGGMNDTSRFKKAFAEQQKLMRELVLLDGESPADALRQAIDYQGENISTLCKLVIPLTKTIAKNSTVSLDTRIEMTSRVVALSQMLNPDGIPFEMNGLIAFDLEKKALSTLPRDLEYGNDGKTVESRLQEIEAAFQRMRYLEQNFFPQLEKAGPETTLRYLEMREQYGATAAVEFFEKTLTPQQ